MIRTSTNTTNWYIFCQHQRNTVLGLENRDNRTPMSPITRQYRTIPDNAPPDSSTHEEHITWQFVFWALVVIAPNCTTQSSNILSWRRDLSPAITPFLRTSPFLCMGDALASIIRLVSYCAVLRVSPAQAVRLLAAARFEINLYHRIRGFGRES
jgi:hypothetical protein